MTLFSSYRERRLWLWTLAVIAAIYSTLELAGKMAGYLTERKLLDTSFFLTFVLLTAAIAASGITKQPKRRETWIALGVLIVYAMMLFRILSPTERTHLVEYGVVGILIFHALSERKQNGRHVPLPAMLAFGITALLGWVDEGIQAILPNRVYDIRDVLFNALAGLVSILTSLALMRIQRKIQTGRSRN